MKISFNLTCNTYLSGQAGEVGIEEPDEVQQEQVWSPTLGEK